MSRNVLEPLGMLNASAYGSVRIAMAVHRLIAGEGPQVVSVDDDGTVRSTPHRHPFSLAVLKDYGDEVAGTYDHAATAAHIREDLICLVQGRFEDAA